LVGGNEVLKDRETGSRWQQATVGAISGPLQGQHLELYPSHFTTWGEWRRRHPDTLVLKPLPGYAERIPAMNEMLRRGLSGEGAAPDGVLRHDGRLPPRTMILGLNVHQASKAFPLPVLRQMRVINDRLGGEPILIVHQPGSDTTTAFLSRIKRKRLTFSATDELATALTDSETHSRWDAYGRCTAGRLRGSQLEELILEPEFWFAWSEFNPNTDIYTAPAPHP
jgi:uncharacterized protein DUF3179